MRNAITPALLEHRRSPETNSRMLEAYCRREQARKELQERTVDLYEATMRHVRAVLGAPADGDLVVEKIETFGPHYRFVVKATKIFDDGSVYLRGPMVKKDGCLSATVEKCAFMDSVILSDRNDRT